MNPVQKKYDPATTIWEITEEGFPHNGSLPQQMKFLLGYAILAPSSHNTQPWKFRLRAEGVIDVLLDYDGWLKVADADQRELHLSVGCALENLLLAAQHFGFTPAVTYFPQPSNEELVASVALTRTSEQPLGDDALFAAITTRRTHHKTFAARAIRAETQQRIQQCCDEAGIQLYLTKDAAMRQQVDDLLVRSDVVTFANPAWREELAYWIGKGVFGTPWLISQLGRLAMAYLNFGGMAQRRDEQVLMSAPVIGLLTATNNDRISQIKAGQIFERIYLTCTREGIGVRPMSQVCQIPEYRAALKALFPAGNFPLQLFLLGYAEPEKGHTPRRAVEEVLI